MIKIYLFSLQKLIIFNCEFTEKDYVKDSLVNREFDFFKLGFPKRIEYILEWNLNNLSVCILSFPFSLKEISKCTNHVNIHKLYAVEYINTVCSLDHPFKF